MTKFPLSPFIEKSEIVFTSGQIHIKDGVLVDGTVTDMSIYGELNKIYASYFQNKYPAREVIGVKELPLGAVIEISMIAIR